MLRLKVFAQKTEPVAGFVGKMGIKSCFCPLFIRQDKMAVCAIIFESPILKPINLCV